MILIRRQRDEYCEALSLLILLLRVNSVFASWYRPLEENVGRYCVFSYITPQIQRCRVC